MENLFNQLRDRKWSLDETVFEHRNKGYGAYQLRSDYNNSLTKALFVGIGLFVGISAVPFLLNTLSIKTVDNVPTILDPINLKHIEDPTKLIVPPKQEKQVQASSEKSATVSVTLPIPSRHVETERTIDPIEVINTKPIGLTNSDGPVITNYDVPKTLSHNGPTTDLPETIVKSSNVIESNVDVEASYKGGIDAFRTVVGQRFNTSVLDEGVVLKSVVSFVVEVDGSISNIISSGENVAFNKEAERTVKSIKNKWTPAKLNGKYVRSYFRIPISMKVE